MKNALLIWGIALALLAPPSMFADTFFEFSFGSSMVHGVPDVPFGALGQFDTIATTTAGVFSIVGISGILSGYPVNNDIITGLSGQVGQQGSITQNNGILSLDTVSFLFNYGQVELSAGSQPLLFSMNTGYLASIQTDPTKGPYDGEIEAASLTLTEAPPTVAATPEPGTFILLGTGLAGMMGVVRRRLFA